MVCCHGKITSYIPTSKVAKSCSYRYISLKLPMLFDLAFQMKCKYIGLSCKTKLYNSLFEHTANLSTFFFFKDKVYNIVKHDWYR